MDTPKRAGEEAEVAPSPAEMLARIKHLAKDSVNVAFSGHAEERMEERGITDLDALRVLRTGDIVGPITAGKNKGEWKCKITAPIKGRREVGVATLLIRNRRLRIKTVEWEDIR